MSAKDHRPGPDPELQRLLDLAERPAAAAAFRARLARSFVHAPDTGSVAPDAPLARALDALPTPAARPSFRTELAQRFVAGPQEPRRRTPAALPRPRRAPRLWPVSAGLAAAALLLVVLRPWRAQEPQWRIDDAFGPAELVVDGTAFPSAPPRALARALHGARVVTSGTRPVRLVQGDRLVLELAQETSVGIDGMVGRSMRLRVDRGSVRVATGPGFAGILTVDAPHLETVVVGTIFGVDVYPEATCLCVTEGRVTARPAEGAERVVAAGHSFVVGPGLYSPQDIPAPHAAPLVALEGVWD